MTDETTPTPPAASPTEAAPTTAKVKAKAKVKTKPKATAPKAKGGKAAAKALAKQLAAQVKKAKTPGAAKAKRNVAGKPVPPKARKRCVFDVVREGLAKDLSNEQIIARMIKEFPDKAPARDEKTAKAHLAWYKWQLKKKAARAAAAKAA